MICLYLKKVFSALAWRWYPVSFFHFLRLTFRTRLIVRARALEPRGRCLEFTAVLIGGTTTLAPSSAKSS